MDDQARKVFISIVAILLFLIPGIGLICFGFASLFDSILGFRFFASDISTYLWYIFGGVCGGFLLLLLAIFVIIFAFRRRKIVATTPPVNLPHPDETPSAPFITPPPSGMDETMTPEIIQPIPPDENEPIAPDEPTTADMDETLTPEEPTPPTQGESEPNDSDEPVPPPG